MGPESCEYLRILEEDSMLKSKFFWINLIGILVNIGQYFITNAIDKDDALLITSIIAILQIIANSLAGATVSNQNKQLKAKIVSMWNSQSYKK
jgi:hypothetical protein